MGEWNIFLCWIIQEWRENKMIGIIVLLTLLCGANVLLLGALAHSGRGQKNTETKMGFGFMAAVLVLDMLFSIGGVVLW